MNKKTLILGASANPARYSYLAWKKLLANGYEVEGLGKRSAEGEGMHITSEKKPFTDIDTITLYLNPAHQKEYYSYILTLKPRRLIFNPGAENPELYEIAKANGIDPIEACTLVLLSTGQY